MHQIAPTFDDHTDLTIAVNLGAKAQSGLKIEKVSKESFSSTKIGEYFSQLKLPNAFSLESTLYKVANNSFDTMQGTLARMKLASYPPDMIIDVPRNLCGTLEFNLSKEVVAYGYNLCEEVMGS